MPAIVVSTFALMSAWAIFWMWTRLYEAEQRAERARREADANRELAAAGRAAADLAHDLGNLVAILHLNLQQLDWHGREAAREMVRDVQNATFAMYRMFEQWRGRAGRLPLPSSALFLETLCSLLGRTGLDVRLHVVATMPYAGSDEDVVRVLENLLLSAGREAVRARDPQVEVEMTAEQLRIRARVREPELLDTRIHEEGTSYEGSTGRGLTIARQAASRIGWRIVHTLEGERVTFLVKPV
jgi:hypothetical protein